MLVYTYSFPEIHSEGVRGVTCLLSEGLNYRPQDDRLRRFGEVKEKAGYREEYLTAIGRSYS